MSTILCRCFWGWNLLSIRTIHFKRWWCLRAHGDMPTWNTYIMLASSDIYNFPEGDFFFRSYIFCKGWLKCLLQMSWLLKLQPGPRETSESEVFSQWFPQVTHKSPMEDKKGTRHIAGNASVVFFEICHHWIWGGNVSSFWWNQQAVTFLGW